MPSEIEVVIAALEYVAVMTTDGHCAFVSVEDGNYYVCEDAEAVVGKLLCYVHLDGSIEWE